MSINISIILLLLSLLPPISSTFFGKPHIINFRSPNLYPEGIAYDPTAHNFIVGSLHNRALLSISDVGTTEILISDPSLPPNATFLGIAVDTVFNRLLAVVHSFPPLPPFNALVAYNLRSRTRVFLSILPDKEGSAVAKDVAVDFKGNAFVTNSLGNSSGNFIWKVNPQGEASIFSRSPVFNEYTVDPHAPFSHYGLNGIGYISEGYLLVVQTNTGKMFKVDAEDGTAKTVSLSKNLTTPDGIAVRSDHLVLVVSSNKLRFLNTWDRWVKGKVFDETKLDGERSPTSVAVGRGERAYVLYGSVFEGIMGNEGREWFEIVEVKSKMENMVEMFLCVLLALALVSGFLTIIIIRAREVHGQKGQR